VKQSRPSGLLMTPPRRLSDLSSKQGGERITVFCASEGVTNVTFVDELAI
jgi:hypothetical protein